MNRRGILGFLAAAPLLSGCLALEPRYTYSYRLSVTIDVDGIVKRASTVIEAGWVRTSFHLWDGSEKYFPIAIGDAVTFDFGGGKYLFALLVPPINRSGFHVLFSHKALAQYLPRTIRGDLPSAYKDPERFVNAIGAIAETCFVPKEQWPVFAAFDDIMDPRTVREAPVQVKEVTMEIMNAPVTRGIDKVLPWLAGRRRSFFGGAKPLVDYPVPDHPLGGQLIPEAFEIYVYTNDVDF
ncbi:MAG TPA: hypothetical protein VHZ29_18565 [Rhizomicrobium sp.]|nr:hypothetical protein [Rhizomicrobium sp.]